MRSRILAHEHLGEAFGTVYDLSTIAILWFAGASAMAGLLNLVPRYLPRYGMAPEWARATRPLVVLFTAITFIITIIFDADVEAQGGAYATGVLVLMTSASVAVTLSVRAQPAAAAGISWLITLVFVYTTIVNIFERPDGVKIASWFIVTIIVTSLVSRVLRSTELRVQAVEPDATGVPLHPRDAATAPVRIIANRPDTRPARGVRAQAARSQRLTPPRRRTNACSSSKSGPATSRSSAATCTSRGVDVGGHRVLRCVSPAIPNAIAALLLYIRDETGKIPHAYFGWTEGNPIVYLLKFLAFGEGDTAPVTREVLRQRESDPFKRPRIHVG